MFYKEIHGNQLFVYHNGRLIYKRWLWRGYGRMFYEGYP